MGDQSTELAELESMKPKILIAGAVLGLSVGLAGAYLLLQRAEKEGETPEFNIVDVVKIGVIAFGFLRSISNI